MEIKEMNIYQKLEAIQNELGFVAKNLNVQVSKTNQYKATGEVDVLEAVKPLEHRYGVYSYPANREILESDTLTQNTQYGEKSNLFIRIKVTYRFVNIDKPSEFIETVSFAEGIDSGDKGSGKAMTYADKYALMKVYKISTGEDPDKDASGEYKKTNSKENKKKKTDDEQLTEEVEKVNEIWAFYNSHKSTFSPVLKGVLQGRKLTDLPANELDGILEIIRKSKHTLGE